MSEKKKHIIWRAIRGEEDNFVQGSIKNALILLAIPMILEMIMESLFAIVDTFWVSRISTEAVATVGITEALLMIIESVAIGVSMAGTALIARRIGEKNPAGAKKIIANVLLVGVSLSIVIGVICFLYADKILLMMGSNAELVEQGKTYTSIILGFNIILMLLFVLNGIFRGAGNAAIAMRTLWLANGLNLILDPLLIFGFWIIPGLGLKGAAIATCIGRGIGVLYQLRYLFKGDFMLRMGLPDFSFSKVILKKIIAIASGGAGQFLIATASWVFLIRIINHFGSQAVAGYTIAIRVIIFSILPSWGLSNAVATLVGQNLGAKEPDRAEKTVWMAGKYNMIFLLVLSIIFFIFSEPIIGIFSDDAVVISYGVAPLRILCAGYIFFAYQMVIGQAFNGAGDTRTPTIMNFSILWLIQIPLAYVMAITWGMGPNGVYITISVCNALLAVLGVYLFRRGKWKETVI